MNPSSQASKTLGTPSSSSSDGAGARPGAVEENLQTSWSAASQSPQPPRPQPQLPAWRQLCEARSTRCSWWSWCFPRVHLSLGQFLGISWILTKSSKRLRLPVRFKGVFVTSRLFFFIETFQLEPSSLRRASLFYTANLGTPKNGPDAMSVW